MVVVKRSINAILENININAILEHLNRHSSLSL